MRAFVRAMCIFAFVISVIYPVVTLADNLANGKLDNFFVALGISLGAMTCAGVIWVIIDMADVLAPPNAVEQARKAAGAK